MPYRVLFVKHSLGFPRANGHDVCGFEMARALRSLGHPVALATVSPPHQPTQEQLDVPWWTLGHSEGTTSHAAPLGRMQERFRSYWGIPLAVVESVAERAVHFDADAVVGLGLDVLPYLAGVRDRVRIWYAADEWVLHHLSQVRVTDRRTYGELRQALIKGLYERAFAPVIDRAWVVSANEQRAMRRYAGIRNVDVLPNGVDTEYFAPAAAAVQPTSAVFWGRLDFGPNLQALDFFCDRVWPRIRKRVPSARLTIVGFNAVDEVRSRAGRDGIDLRTDVPDIRPIVAEHQVAILPMVSGGGIKNKLLEAAALAKAIVCTNVACGGLRGTPPAVIVDDERGWVDALVSLWERDDERRRLEQAARAWIVERHTWRAAARDALKGLEASLAAREHRASAPSWSAIK